MNKQELKYILYTGIFGIVWFFLLLPKLVAYFGDNAPLVQFLIFNIGLYIFFFIFLKSMITLSKDSFRITAGLLVLFLALDTIMPDYHVYLDGTLVRGAMLGVSSTDYTWGTIGQSLGIHGSMLFYFVYFVVPMLLLLLAAKLLPNFVKRL